MKTKMTAYWVTTAIVALVLMSGGIAQLLRRPENVEGMTHLGYPLYLSTVLGVWKVLGAIALLSPRFPRIKEWAYAGAFFDLTGAAVSHAFCGDAVGHVIGPVIFAALALASWALRPPSRTLGVVFSTVEQSGCARDQSPFGLPKLDYGRSE